MVLLKLTLCGTNLNDVSWQVVSFLNSFGKKLLICGGGRDGWNNKMVLVELSSWILCWLVESRHFYAILCSWFSLLIHLLFANVDQPMASDSSIFVMLL